MPKLTEEETEGLKNSIDKLTPSAMKQVLSGMAIMLSRLPSIRAQDFIDYVTDAVRFTLHQEGR